jgi:hypothetical protein
MGIIMVYKPTTTGGEIRGMPGYELIKVPQETQGIP